MEVRDFMEIQKLCAVHLRICEYLDCDIGTICEVVRLTKELGGNMGFIQNIIDQHQKKVQTRNDACNDLISRIDDALHDAKSIFSAPQVFIDPHTETEWRIRNSGILADSEEHKILQLKRLLNINYYPKSNLNWLMLFVLCHIKFFNITSELRA